MPHIATNSGSGIATSVITTPGSSGNLLIAAGVGRASGTLTISGTGWTERVNALPSGSSMRLKIWTKVHSGSEDATYTITQGSSIQCAGFIAAYSNATYDTVTTGDTGPFAYTTVPTATAAGATSLWLGIATNREPDIDSDFTMPTGWTAERVEENSGVGANDVGIVLAEESVGSGATGTADFTHLTMTVNRIAASLILTEVTGPTIETQPTEITKGSTGSFIVSGPATAPTTGNTTITANAGADSLTVDSVTGSDPYTINFTCTLTVSMQCDAVGDIWKVTIDAENVDSTAIPLDPQTGWAFVDLVSPNTASDQSLLYGYTGDAPVTGDQLEYDITPSPGPQIWDSVSAEGFGTLSGLPTVTQTTSRRVIQADGTVGVAADYVLEVGSNDSLISNIIRDITSNVIVNSIS
jgi:hypothetical protein